MRRGKYWKGLGTARRVRRCPGVVDAAGPEESDLSAGGDGKVCASPPVRPAQLRALAPVQLRFQTGLPGAGGVRLYNPLWEVNPRFVELALGNATAETGHRIVAALQKSGVAVAVTRPERIWGTNRLLAAYFKPLALYLMAGGCVRDLHGTLQSFGFRQMPYVLLQQLGSGAVAHLLKPDIMVPRLVLKRLLREEGGGDQDDSLLDALTITLAAAAFEGLEDGTFPQRAVLDLLAREVLRFPLVHTSLSHYLSRDRVAQAVRWRSYVVQEPALDRELASARRFLAQGKELAL